MKKTKLTVLIPNYNKGKYIAKALNSVISQKTNFRFNLLIIDDASTDDSVKIINNFISRFPQKIKFIQNKRNLRCLATSLKGYSLIKSEYFCVLDPDDYWINENKLQKAVDFLDQHEDFTIYIANNYIKEKGKRKTSYFKVKSRDFNFNELNNAVFGHTSGTIFRNVVFKNGIPKDIYKSINTIDEKVYEGDSFRNLLHLNQGKAHFENKLESVYRVTRSGIWTSLNIFQQNSLNARFFLKMYLYFDKKEPEFFIKTCWYFCQKNLNILNDSENISKISKKELSEWEIILIRCLKYKNTLFPLEQDAYLSSYFLFFLPSRVVGGYEFLFIRLAKFLSETLNFNVFYIDYRDGFARTQLRNTKINFIDFKGANTIVDIDKPVNLISPITMSHQVPFLWNSSSKLIFWCAHPKSIPWLAGRSNMDPLKLSSFLSLLNQSNSVCFMDWACWQKTRKISKINFAEVYVPIFTTEKTEFIPKYTNKLISFREINVGWLGRLDFDKIYSLINLLDNLNELSTNLKINIHIIGSGDSKHLINISKYPKKIKIIFTSTIINNDLYEYLDKHVDILFAMGTSALESASLKIPSVLVFSGTKPITSDKFVWLFNSKKFTLGSYSNQNKRKIKTNTLKEIVTEVYENNNKSILGTKCYEYFIENHSINSTFLKLLTFTLKDSLTYDKYPLNKVENSVSSLAAQKPKMTRVFVSFHNGIVDDFNRDAMPCFYESFLTGLKDNGNEVLYFSTPTWLPENISQSKTLLDRVKAFDPDLIILFNNNCWTDLTKDFDCPIIIYEVDSPLYYNNLELITKDPNRYKYIVPQTASTEVLKNKFNINSNNIYYLPFFTSVVAENIPQTTNISFIGTNFPYSETIHNFFQSNPDKNEISLYQKIIKYIENNPFSSLDFLIDKFKIGSEKVRDNLDIEHLLFDLSSKNRIQILSQITDLGLDLFGSKSWTNITGQPELALCYKNKSVYSLKHNQDIYNSSKLSININHIQAQTGFSWRVSDIMASNSCLVSPPAKDFEQLFPNIKIPTFSNKYEARQICLNLLNNKNIRKDIVLACQEIIDKKYRFCHLVTKIEQIVNIPLSSKEKGTITKLILNDSKHSQGEDVLKKIGSVFRTKTRLELMLYSSLMIINQIPLLNKPLMSRNNIFKNIENIIKNDKNPK